MKKTLDVKIVSQERFGNAVGRYCMYVGLNSSTHFEQDPSVRTAKDPFVVDLMVGGDALTAQVVDIIGTGVLLQFSESSPSRDGGMRCMYFAARRVPVRTDAEDDWEMNDAVYIGGDSIKLTHLAARTAARYIFA
jgi:hypothetical protein